MSKIKATLLEWGTNKVIKAVYFEGHIPAIGDFFIDDSKITDDWKTKMYIVKAVTHFTGDFVALHITKYNVDAEEAKWKEAVKYWEEIKNKMKEDGKNGEK